MKLIFRNLLVISTISIISAILAFYPMSYNKSTAQEELQKITNQINKELSTIRQKYKQPRVLSEQLIQQISIFSHTCPLEKVVVDGVKTKELYSVEKGKLLLNLLNLKLAKTTYDQIFKIASFNSAFLRNANLKRINLSGIQLSNAYLVGAELRHTNLEKVNLYKANLSKADLSNANLSMANLREAIFLGANMSNAIFKNAYLVEAKLGNAKLDDADFTKANLSGVDFRNSGPSIAKP